MDNETKNRDDIKRERSLMKKKKDMVETVGSVVDVIIANLELWFKPLLQKIRKLTYTATSQPNIFPPSQNITTTTSSTPTTKLTQQFAADIY